MVPFEAVALVLPVHGMVEFSFVLALRPLLKYILRSAVAEAEELAKPSVSDPLELPGLCERPIASAIIVVALERVVDGCCVVAVDVAVAAAVAAVTSAVAAVVVVLVVTTDAPCVTCVTETVIAAGF